MLKLKIRAIMFLGLVGLLLISTVNAKQAELFRANKNYDIVVIDEFDENISLHERSLNRKLKFNLKKDGIEKNLTWNGPLGDFSSDIYSFNGKIILEATLPHQGSPGSMHGKTLIIIDADNGLIQDTVRCLDYSLSPSKRFLVYLTWYPRMVSPGFRKSMILSYDLSKSADGNRLPIGKKFTYRNAGLPIFPESSANFENLDPNDIEKGIDDSIYDITPIHHYFLNSPFLWSEDETTLVFMVYDNDMQKNYLVKVRYSSEGFTIDRSYIDVNKLIKWDILQEDSRQMLTKRVYSLSVTSMVWGEDNKVVVKPFEQYWLDKEITLTLP